MSQFNAPSYHVSKPTNTCAATGRALAPGESYFATLVDVPESEIERDAAGKPVDNQALGLRRVDVSQDAWDEGYRPAHLFSYWKTTVAQADERKQKLLVDDAVLMNLLEQLAEAEQPERLAFRYVLGLILIRKKLLRFDGVDRRTREATDGEGNLIQVEQNWWRLTPKVDLSKGRLGKWDENRTLEVLDPGLSEDQIQQVTTQMGEIFEAELD